MKLNLAMVLAKAFKRMENTSASVKRVHLVLSTLYSIGNFHYCYVPYTVTAFLLESVLDIVS